ncbi:YlxR family protein [Actinobacteria bacterium YIM 96077]|uniref:YlxR family protein n=1 Tax=Phytoactinopolyspora halophila TaxID=1981511 RepID=A0A329R0J0_9ACTN|nr:YlxR family protein [Actinobacteria bacterium YIM 96077]RAW16428.1 YlxR family protein [Phytoactinopolyspora halophila]
MATEGRASGHQPIRTCVGCRSRTAKSELLRVVAQGSSSEIELVPDPGGRRPGRGAYIHPRTGCLDVAERRRAFARSFRRGGRFDVSLVRRWLDATAGA